MFKVIERRLINDGFRIITKDHTRPWGGFFVIDEDQSQEFADLYFDGIDVHELKISGKLSPKILVIAPVKKLSWQYHNRRSEIWQVVSGEAGLITSATDQAGLMKIIKAGDKVKLDQGERHRLVGLDDWAVVAEIWQHTDKDNPSDEDDIIRVQDDFGR